MSMTELRWRSSTGTTQFVKNDIGSATAFWMIKNNKVLQPAGGDWATTSRFMTPAGAAALSAACGSETAPGQPLATSTDSDCADEIVAVLEEKTRDGQAAFDTVTITAGQKPHTRGPCS